MASDAPVCVPWLCFYDRNSSICCTEPSLPLTPVIIRTRVASGPQRRDQVGPWLLLGIRRDSPRLQWAGDSLGRPAFGICSPTVLSWVLEPQVWLPLPAPCLLPCTPASVEVSMTFIPARLPGGRCPGPARTRRSEVPATWAVMAPPRCLPLSLPLQELIHENMPKMGTESRCLLSSAAWPNHCHQEGQRGLSFIKRGGPGLGAKCLILTCLNQQVLTEVGSGGEYKEPAFPNRNLLKVAWDLEWGVSE